MHDELLQLMVQFKLCYEIPSRLNSYIAPQLLSFERPDYFWIENPNLTFCYRYDFMPKGILTRLIVELYQFIEQQQLVWRTGVVLTNGNARAEVIEHYHTRELRIRVSGSDQKRWLSTITHEIEKIHHSYDRLQYQTLVPCNCSTCRESQTPSNYPYELLQQFLRDARFQVQCQESYEMVDVRYLINGNVKEVFISYAWGSDDESLANRIDQIFQPKGITLIRDKRDLGFQGRVKAFMEQIGKGKAVIMVISDKYLKSENCMFELVEIVANGNFDDRIFPIVLDDAQIYKPIKRIRYIQHWEQEITDLQEAIKTVKGSNIQGFRESIDLYTRIRATIADITETLKDMNTLTPDIHTESGFAELISAIEQCLEN